MAQTLKNINTSLYSFITIITILHLSIQKEITGNVWLRVSSTFYKGQASLITIHLSFSFCISVLNSFTILDIAVNVAFLGPIHYVIAPSIVSIILGHILAIQRVRFDIWMQLRAQKAPGIHYYLIILLGNKFRIKSYSSDVAV